MARTPFSPLAIAATCLLSLLTAAGCTKDCPAIPCPAPGFDQNTCSCITSAAPSGTAGAAGSSTGSTPQTDAGSRSPCDPLTAVTSTVTLAPTDIVDAGTESDGTVYVLVEQSSDLRLFVGSETSLSELYVSGSGQGASHSPGEFWTVQSMTADGSLVTVEVQSASTGLVMGVVKGPVSGKGFDVGTVGDVLEPLSAAYAASIPATTTQTFHVEYVGASSSATVVVVAPDHAESYDGFRLFLGPLDDLAEQPVSTVNRGLSIPSNTYVDFSETDGATSEPASLTYGIGSGTLTVAGVTTTLADAASATVPANAVFECL